MSDFQLAMRLLAKAARATNINVGMGIFCQYFLAKRGHVAAIYRADKAESQKLNGKPLGEGGFKPRSFSIELLEGFAHRTSHSHGADRWSFWSEKKPVSIPCRNVDDFRNGIERIGRERRPLRDRVCTHLGTTASKSLSQGMARIGGPSPGGARQNGRTIFLSIGSDRPLPHRIAYCPPISFLNVSKSTCMPLKMVLQWRVSAAIATASWISSSVAPARLASCVSDQMQ